jgi:predicted nucleic acid-binding protein
MILIDSSVLIHYFRTGSSAVLEVFESVECGICGVTRSEILHGARSESDAERLRAAFAPFTAVLIPESTWDRLGGLLALFRQNGLAVPFQDALLAAVALEYDVELWTTDRHFELMQRLVPSLRLFNGPS